MERLAAWATGEEHLGTKRYPKPLWSRNERWLVVAVHLNNGELLSQGGNLAVPHQATGAQRAALRTLALAENADRLRTWSMTASLLDLSPEETEAWSRQWAQVCSAWDRAARQGQRRVTARLLPVRESDPPATAPPAPGP